jgi:DNA polymerase-3 subunit chi
MSRIDFYILEKAATQEERWRFVCRLVDKAWRSGNRILLLTEDANQAQAMDQLLWTFKPESFIPHQLLDPAQPLAAPVEISGQLPTHYVPGEKSLLINLSSKVPQGFERFERVSEIVIQDPEVLKNTREHYSFYRQGGYAIDSHRI